MKPFSALRLWNLALGAFAIGTEGYALAGLLPKVAADVGVTVPVAGQLITAFSLAFAVGSPLLAVLTGHFERKRLLMGSMLVFAAFNVGAIKAAQQVFDEVNAKGGIAGRKIRFVVEDHGYQVPKAVQNFNKLINSDHVFAMILNLGTPHNIAGFPLMQ